jgi:hypothetical protein
MKPDKLEIQQNRNLVKSSIQPMPSGEKVGYVARRRMENAESASQRKSAETDPKINPAGKAQFTGAYAPFKNYSHHYTYAKPDQRHAARLRGKRAHWDKKP